MSRKLVFSAILLSLVLVFVACSGSTTKPATPAQTPAPQTPQLVTPSTTVVVPPPPTATAPSSPKPSGPIKAKWIEPKVNGSTIAIPASEIKSNWNNVFKITKQGGNLTFMAYVLDNEIQVRATACPPCRGITYSLDNDILVCDTCATTFKAKTGAGIKGPCVNYPKAAVQYKIVDGNIVMNEADLVNAYQETLKAG